MRFKFVAWVVNNVVLEMMTQQEDSQPVPSRRVRRLGGSQIKCITCLFIVKYSFVPV